MSRETLKICKRLALVCGKCPVFLCFIRSSSQNQAKTIYQIHFTDDPSKSFEAGVSWLDFKCTLCFQLELGEEDMLSIFKIKRFVCFMFRITISE